MTGFGYCERETEKYYAAVEIKSYNNRYLDLQINLPPFLSPLEPKIREFMSSRVKRGRVEVYLRFRELEEDLTIRLDKKVAREYAEVLRSLKAETGIEEELNLSHLLRMEGILKSSRSRDVELYWQALEPLMQEAAEAFIAVRRREGTETRKDILDQIETIEEALGKISATEGELEAFFTETVRKRFNEVLGDQVEENRILTEIAALMVKYTIHEELVRLKGHLNSFREIIDDDAGAGKKLDFLAQEIHREINTIGSKSVQYNISSGVVQMKDALENIREQLRNVE
jgi:uncharacterized protein (TIGR00255 family)